MGKASTVKPPSQIMAHILKKKKCYFKFFDYIVESHMLPPAERVFNLNDLQHTFFPGVLLLAL